MKLYKIFIPKFYNDGKRIEINKIRKIAEDIRMKFGAYSANPYANFPIIEGTWTSDTTQKFIEISYF